MTVHDSLHESNSKTLDANEQPSDGKHVRSPAAGDSFQDTLVESWRDSIPFHISGKEIDKPQAVNQDTRTYFVAQSHDDLPDGSLRTKISNSATSSRDRTPPDSNVDSRRSHDLLADHLLSLQTRDGDAELPSRTQIEKIQPGDPAESSHVSVVHQRKSSMSQDEAPVTDKDLHTIARSELLNGMSDLPLRSSQIRTLHPDPLALQLQQVVFRDRAHSKTTRNLTIETKNTASSSIVSPQPRPATSRALSTPAQIRSPDLLSANSQRPSKPRTISKSDNAKTRAQSQSHQVPTSSSASAPLPLPPLSLPTYLQLELSSHRPSQLYIYRSSDSDFPYESSRVKIERLLNFLLLPYQLEAVLWFGTLACFDSWLYTFTVLPLRLLKSFYILGQSLVRNVIFESRFVAAFIFKGTRRVWQRRRTRSSSVAPNSNPQRTPEIVMPDEKSGRMRSRSLRHHRRTKSVPSSLLPDDKADILKGLLIIFTCLVLLRLDASRMYHWVRGQAAIKLYVIYNVLEVCDRLLSAIGQDVLECLFSQETLERKPNGHSKILRPFWLFTLALAYTVVHATALFYQVVTLNVAVNSYSNALITLLISNQFVEIKSTVFKKFEKENLFQLTCADVVERFQLWHMLIIIAARNIVETGGLNWGSSALASATNTSIPFSKNTSSSASQAIPPLTAGSILPSSFMFLPSLVSSINSFMPTISQVLGPFVIVLGSEMLIDWLKHSYISKFNNTRPVIYGRFLDILAKDYYTNAFGDQNLTKRLGLPVIPLSCLMIRASVQTYHMFVAAWMPDPSPSATSLASIHEQYSASRNSAPTSTAAAMVQKVDELLYQIPSSIINSEIASYLPTILILLLVFLVLLACKLLLGMILLAFSRARFRTMRERERNPPHHIDGARRVGGWGVVEVDEAKRQRILEDDPTALRTLREREAKEQAKREAEKDKGPNVEGLDRVMRYEMAAKRIW